MKVNDSQNIYSPLQNLMRVNKNNQWEHVFSFLHFMSQKLIIGQTNGILCL